MNRFKKPNVVELLDQAVLTPELVRAFQRKLAIDSKVDGFSPTIVSDTKLVFRGRDLHQEAKAHEDLCKQILNIWKTYDAKDRKSAPAALSERIQSFAGSNQSKSNLKKYLGFLLPPDKMERFKKKDISSFVGLKKIQPKRSTGSADK